MSMAARIMVSCCARGLSKPLDADWDIAYKDGQYYLPNDEVSTPFACLC
jgi:hypothetical protein